MEKMKFNITDDGVQTVLGYGELDISSDEKFGFRPFQLMISSIVSCSGMVFRNILKKKRIDFETIEVKADIQRNPDEANRIEIINLTYIVSGPDLNLEQLNKSL